MNNINLHKPLAFFDLETTGIDPVNDRIVEIAIIKINPDKSREQLVSRVNPEMPIPTSASEVHGIYDKDVKDAPTFYQIANKVKSFLENCDIAGYNSNKFDIPVLLEEFYRAGLDVDLKKRKLIDVQQIFFLKEKRTLSAAYDFYCNKELTNAHNALADVEATIDILDAQIARYDDLPNNVANIFEFTGANDIVDYACRMVKKNDQVYFNFGKYKGKLVKDVLLNEPQYYDWMMNADFARDTKKALSEIYNEVKLGRFIK